MLCEITQDITSAYKTQPSQENLAHRHIEHLYVPHATVWVYIVISQRTSQSGNVKSKK